MMSVQNQTSSINPDRGRARRRVGIERPQEPGYQ
jgi:hypothetical protein